MIDLSQPFGTMLLGGDVRRVLRHLPDASVQCCVTSPPYYGLRDYGHVGQLGLEQTPTAYVDALVDVFRQVHRVLADDGTLWLNLGDTYASAWACNRRNVVGNGSLENGKREARPNRLAEGLKEKDLMGIPWRVAFALQADGWYLRQDIIWHKPNPMPENVTDRCTKAHEYIFLLSKQPRYFFDSTPMQEPATCFRMRGPALHPDKKSTNGNGGLSRREPAANRNRRSVWTVTTSPFRGAHFATFPPDLIEPCILAGSRPGDIVLDPFGGSGTTALVSRQHGRRAVYVELNPEYIEIARARLTEVP